MTTANTKSKSAPAAPERAASEAICNYLDFLSSSQEKFAKSLKEARVRASRLNEGLVEAMLESQRQALETSKRLAANPSDYAANIKTVIEAATAAQERSLGLAKTLYQEQADVTAELRGMLQSVFESSKDINETARKFAAFWPKSA